MLVTAFIILYDQTTRLPKGILSTCQESKDQGGVGQSKFKDVVVRQLSEMFQRHLFRRRVFEYIVSSGGDGQMLAITWYLFQAVIP